MKLPGNEGAKTPFSSDFANLHPRFAPFFNIPANYFLPEILSSRAMVRCGTWFVVHLKGSITPPHTATSQHLKRVHVQGTLIICKLLKNNEINHQEGAVGGTISSVPFLHTSYFNILQ